MGPRRTMGERGGGRPEPEAPLAAVARFTGHGLTLALSTGLFLLLGWWADGRLGWTPILTILGALVGAAAGFYSLLQHLVLRPPPEEGGGSDGSGAGGGT